MQGVYVLGADVFTKTWQRLAEPRYAALDTSDQSFTMTELRDGASNEALKLSRTERTPSGDVSNSRVEARERSSQSPRSARYIDSKALEPKQRADLFDHFTKRRRIGVDKLNGLSGRLVRGPCGGKDLGLPAQG